MRNAVLRTFVLLILMASGDARGAFIFNVTPQAGVDLSNIALGQSFTLTITEAPTTAADFLTVFGLGESFGPSPVFRVDSIVAGDVVGPGSSFTTSSTPTNFYLRFVAGTPVTRAGTIATISLTAIQPGRGRFFNYYSEFAGAAYGNPGLINNGFEPTYNVVPEPSSLALVAMGLFGACGISRRLI